MPLQPVRPLSKVVGPAKGPCSFKTKLFILASPIPAYRVLTHASCHHNEMASLCNRHLIAQPNLPDLPYIRAGVKNIAIDLKASPVSIWTIANKYMGGKRLMYLRACKTIEAQGWNKHWANVSMFVKPDKIPAAEISTKAPRAIQYRSPMYNLLIGRFLHGYEKALYDWPDVGPSRTPFMAKGKNLQERASILVEKISCFKDPLFICLDHSKFDSSISEELLGIEHRYYNKHFKSKFLRFLLRKQLNNKGYTKSGIKYRVRGTRMSGDFNTGLGNSLINYLCLRSWLDSASVKGEIFLDGDDSIIIVEADQQAKLNPEHFSRWGFTTKIQITKNINEVEFCQCRLLPSGPTMARNPYRALSHLAVSLKKYTGKVWPRIQQARGMCEAIGSSGVPILEAYGRALLTGVKPMVPPEDREKWDLALRSKQLEVTDDIRLEYWLAWGIDPHMQELIEESFSDPDLLSVGRLASNSDFYDAESLQAAWEGWCALGADRGQHWCSSGP